MANPDPARDRYYSRRPPAPDPQPAPDEFHETLAPTAPAVPGRTYRSEVVPVTRPSAAEQIVRLVAVVLDVLLALRFVLAAFGANLANGFVRFIFNTTDWLVQPFRGTFRVTLTGQGGFFDWAALIAIVVVSLLAALIIALLRPKPGRPV